MRRWLSFFSRLLSSGNNPGGYQLEKAYVGLRNLIVTTAPSKIGVASTDPDEVWGILMETGHQKAVASLVALADGTISLYFSSGGGFIGLGPLPGPKAAAESFLANARQFAKEMRPTMTFPLPKIGFTNFYLLTVGGARATSGKEDNLGYGRHALSPLFYKGQELITEIRKVDERQRGNPGQTRG